MDKIRVLEDEVARQLPEDAWVAQPPTEYRAASDLWTQAVWSAAQELGPHMLSAENVERGLRLSGRMVFICGVHRSGTTLVRDLLDGHPQLSVLPSEGSHFTTHYPRMRWLPDADAHRLLARAWLDRLANPINQAPFWMLGRTTGTSSPYVEFVRELTAWEQLLASTPACAISVAPHAALMLAYAACSHEGQVSGDLKWLVEKTPTNEFHLRRLRRALPQARVIHVVRHPYSIFASRKRIEELSFGAFTCSRAVLDAMRRSFAIAAAASNEEDYLVVRYEDILADRDAFALRIAQFLEIEPHEALLRPTVAGRPATPNSSFSTAPDTPYSRSAELTAEERRTISALVARSAATFGYNLEPVGSVERWLRLAKRSRRRS